MPAIRRFLGFLSIAWVTATTLAQNPPAGAAVIGVSENRAPSTIASVRALPMAEARMGMTVTIRGVVTYYEPKWDTLFVQDESAGIFIYPRDRTRPRYHAGQLVEVRGRTFGTRHGNSVVEEQILELGKAAMPPAQAISYADLQRGKYDSQWVELNGVVRIITGEFQRIVMELDCGGRVEAHLPRIPSEALPVHLLHARVKVRGVAGNILSPADEVVGGRLFVPNPESFELITSGSGNPFDEPVRPIGEITRPKSGELAVRTHIRGVVSLHWPTGKVFIQEGNSGIEVELIQERKFNDPEGAFYPNPAPVQFKVGDRIDVVGYPAIRDPDVILEESEVRIVDAGVGIRAEPILERTSLESGGTARLVEFRARFIEQLPPDDSRPGVRRFLCESHSRRFEARLHGMDPLTTPLLPESSVRVTGVMEKGPGSAAQIGSFLVWLRSPADMDVVSGPPIWRTREAIRVLVLAGLAAVVALGWIAMLRRKVTERTAELRDTNEKLQQALAKERELGQLKSNFVSLVSHEFRTPLGIIMSSGEILEHYHERLDAEKRQHHLQAIHKSVRRMADMMSEVLLLGKVEAGGLEYKPAPFDLQGFCLRIRDEISAATNQATPILFDASSPMGDACGDETVLGHIFTNLLSNAVKYSKPGVPIRFSVQQSDGKAIFVVEDNGCGIPEGDRKRLFQAFQRGHNVRQIPGTGLGLVIVKRCVDLHGGTIEVTSREGEGTRFTVVLPLFAQLSSHPTMERSPA